MWFALTAADGTEVWPVAPEGWEGRSVLSNDPAKDIVAQAQTYVAIQTRRQELSQLADAAKHAGVIEPPDYGPASK